MCNREGVGGNGIMSVNDNTTAPIKPANVTMVM